MRDSRFISALLERSEVLLKIIVYDVPERVKWARLLFDVPQLLHVGQSAHHQTTCEPSCLQDSPMRGIQCMNKLLRPSRILLRPVCLYDKTGGVEEIPAIKRPPNEPFVGAEHQYSMLCR